VTLNGSIQLILNDEFVLRWTYPRILKNLLIFRLVKQDMLNTFSI